MNFPAYRIKIRRITICSTLLVAGIALATTAFKKEEQHTGVNNAASMSEADIKASQEAFMKVYKVFMSPRCMNCHPAGDVPLNGDDNHLHPQGIKRGKDGKGLYALKCTNCHQVENTPGLNMPPGAEEWHLPPADMKMVFEGKTPYELAKQMKDPKQNGGKSLQDLIEHMKTDLVKWGWEPGDGRTIPPMSYTEFYDTFKKWIDTGAALPDKNAR